MKPLPLAFLFSFGVVSVPAQSLLFDFGPISITTNGSRLNSPGHAAGAVSLSEITWNKIDRDDVTSGLKYSDNTNATGVRIDLGVETMSSSEIIDFSTQPLNSLQGNNSAYSTGIHASGDSVTRDFIYNSFNDEPWSIGARIGGLSAGIYNVYISGANTNAAAAVGDMHFFASAITAGAAMYHFNGATTASATNDSGHAASWTAGENYVMLSITITAGEDLAIAVSGTGTNAGGRGFLNSLEIVRVGNIPEPSTFSVVAGVIALAGCGGRRCRSAA